MLQHVIHQGHKSGSHNICWWLLGGRCPHPPFHFAPPRPHMMAARCAAHLLPWRPSWRGTRRSRGSTSQPAWQGSRQPKGLRDATYHLGSYVLLLLLVVLLLLLCFLLGPLDLCVVMLVVSLLVVLVLFLLLLLWLF